MSATRISVGDNRSQAVKVSTAHDISRSCDVFSLLEKDIKNSYFFLDFLLFNILLIF